MTLTPGSLAHQHKTKVDRELAALPGVLGRIRLRVALIRELGELQMGLNDDLTTDLDVLQTTVTDVISFIGTLKQANADLAAQIAQGPPGLTQDQALAIQARFAAIEQQAKDAIAPAAPGATT